MDEDLARESPLDDSQSREGDSLAPASIAAREPVQAYLDSLSSARSYHGPHDLRTLVAAGALVPWRRALGVASAALLVGLLLGYLLGRRRRDPEPPENSWTTRGRIAR